MRGKRDGARAPGAIDLRPVAAERREIAGIGGEEVGGEVARDAGNERLGEGCHDERRNAAREEEQGGAESAEHDAARPGHDRCFPPCRTHRA